MAVKDSKIIGQGILNKFKIYQKIYLLYKTTLKTPKTIIFLH